MQKWDYGWVAKYFVTIVTKNREHYFGKIINGKMILSEIGKIVRDEWLKTPNIRPDMNIKLGVFCVMPNHFHGIIEIGKNKYNKPNFERDSVRDSRDLARRDAMHCISTTIAPTEPPTESIAPTKPSIESEPSKSKNKFGSQSKNLASINRGIKSAVTTYARKNNIDFGWQSRYYDHIIRDDDEYQRIKNYIINNPKNWNEDKFK